jgi:hypothetical protein
MFRWFKDMAERRSSGHFSKILLKKFSPSGLIGVA